MATRTTSRAAEPPARPPPLAASFDRRGLSKSPDVAPDGVPSSASMTASLVEQSRARDGAWSSPWCHRRRCRAEGPPAREPSIRRDGCQGRPRHRSPARSHLAPASPVQTHAFGLENGCSGSFRGSTRGSAGRDSRTNRWWTAGDNSQTFERRFDGCSRKSRNSDPREPGYDNSGMPTSGPALLLAKNQSRASSRQPSRRRSLFRFEEPCCLVEIIGSLSTTLREMELTLGVPVSPVPTLESHSWQASDIE